MICLLVLQYSISLRASLYGCYVVCSDVPTSYSNIYWRQYSTITVQYNYKKTGRSGKLYFLLLGPFFCHQFVFLTPRMSFIVVQ
jgi:hypothetical protein